jgi:hypothetical protein
MSQSLAVALSMVVMPDKTYGLHAIGEGLDLYCVMCLKKWEEDRLNVLVRLIALVDPAAVGHQMVPVAALMLSFLCG